MKLGDTSKFIVGLLIFGLLAGCSGDDGYTSGGNNDDNPTSDNGNTGNDTGGDNGDNGGDGSGGTINSFVEIQTQILNPKCVSCHSGFVPSANIDLTNYDAVVDDPTVVSPGHPENSRLFIQVSNGSMPPGPNDLTQDQLDAIERWIEAGAPEGSF